MAIPVVPVKQDELEGAMLAVLTLLEEQLQDQSRSTDLAVVAAENILQCLPATHPLQQPTSAILASVNSGEAIAVTRREVAQLEREWRTYLEQHS
jgi:hypothetical protein